jgi:hypothetical protein
LSREQLAERLVPLEHEALLLAECEAVQASTRPRARYDSPLPRSLQLTTAAGVATALQILMPGPWAPDESLLPQAPFPRSAYEGQRAAALEADLQALLRAVAFSSEQSIADPFSGDGSTVRVFSRECLPVFSNDADSNMISIWHRDALQPSFYSDLSAHLGGLDVIVMSPPSRSLDLALPLAVRHARDVVCCLVPTHYLADAPPGRSSFLSWLRQQGRISVLVNLPRGNQSQRSVWLCIFGSSYSRDHFRASTQWLEWEVAP